MSDTSTAQAPIDLRCGRWEDVLGDVTCDALITDPPFGARTHEAYAVGGTVVEGYGRSAISFGAWRSADVSAFVNAWSPRCRGWFVALTSDDLIDSWRSAFEANGRVTFQSIPCVLPGMTVRLSGDGPSSWAVYAVVSRPKGLCKWGTLPGAYVTRLESGKVPIGEARGGGGGRGKPLDLMRALVSDYSRPGDLICDPCAGYGSTLAAAVQKGRRAVGAEMDPAVHAEAVKRLAGVQYVDLFDPGRPKQSGLEL